MDGVSRHWSECICVDSLHFNNNWLLTVMFKSLFHNQLHLLEKWQIFLPVKMCLSVYTKYNVYFHQSPCVLQRHIPQHRASGSRETQRVPHRSWDHWSVKLVLFGFGFYIYNIIIHIILKHLWKFNSNLRTLTKLAS